MSLEYRFSSILLFEHDPIKKQMIMKKRVLFFFFRKQYKLPAFDRYIFRINKGI